MSNSKDCQICCEKFNKSTRLLVKCNYCEFETCRTCFQKYILESVLDPHCMNCRKVFLREFLITSCTSTFIYDKLKKHRENVLLEREKAMLPATQHHVVIFKERKKMIANVNQTNIEIRKLESELRRLKQHRNDTQWELVRLNNGQGSTSSQKEVKLFIRKCPIGDCRGFLNDKWICGTCEVETCSKCNERKTDDHECNEDSIKSMELLKKDTKPCPGCGTMIHKINGCSQIFCVECHIAFDWVSGVICTGVIHNPHYYEYLRKQNNGVIPRNPGDIPGGGCGAGIPNIHNFQYALRNMGLEDTNVSLYFNFHRSISHIQHVEIKTIANPNDESTNRDLRVLYLLNEINEDYFKKTIQQKEKKFQKERDFNNIYQMFVDVGGDIIRQVINNNCVIFTKRTIVDIRGLVKYFNESIESVGKQYKCVYPGINPNFTFEFNYADYLDRVEKQRLRAVIIN